MSLADEVTKRKAQERADAARRANPELEAKLDRFIAENPQLREHYNVMSKEQLIRKLLISKMERAEVAVVRDRELAQWVKENPDIVAKVERRVNNTVAENRQRIGVNAAKVESVSQGIRGLRI